jgi:hypothetical protein
MVFVALKRLVNRPILTLLSIAGVVLAVGLVTSIPIFSQAVSFVMLREELAEMAAKTGRPLFSMRVYVLPSARYELPLEHTKELGRLIEETLVAEVGLPLLTISRHIETTGLIIRTLDKETPYGEPNTFLGETNLAVLPELESRIDILEGESMLDAAPSEGALSVWKWVFVQMSCSRSAICGVVRRYWFASPVRGKQATPRTCTGSRILT